MYNAVPRKVALSDFKGRERVDDEKNTINDYNKDYRLLPPISKGLEIVILAVISFSDFKEDTYFVMIVHFFFLPLIYTNKHTLDK